MSKYRVIQAEFKSEPALRQALEDACGEFNIRYEYHAEGASLYGFQGDLRPERAELIAASSPRRSRRTAPGPGGNPGRRP